MTETTTRCCCDRCGRTINASTSTTTVQQDMWRLARNLASGAPCDLCARCERVIGVHLARIRREPVTRATRPENGARPKRKRARKAATTAAPPTP